MKAVMVIDIEGDYEWEPLPGESEDASVLTVQKEIAQVVEQALRGRLPSLLERTFTVDVSAMHIEYESAA